VVEKIVQIVSMILKISLFNSLVQCGLFIKKLVTERNLTTKQICSRKFVLISDCRGETGLYKVTFFS